MKLKDLLEWEVDEDPPESSEELPDEIKRDCAKFLKENVTLYRGMIGHLNHTSRITFDTKKNFGKVSVRKDRKSKDLPDWMHNTLNEFFHERIGIPLRSQAVFGIKSFDTALEYGSAVYKIYPIGNYHSAYSNLIQDPYVLADAGEGKQHLADALKAVNIEYDPRKTLTPKILRHILDSGVYKFDAPLSGADKQSEIMIACDSYYVIPFDGTYD